MNASTESQPSSSFDSVKWIITFVLLGGAVFGNYYFANESVLIRAVAVLAAVIVAGLVSAQTEKGKNTILFAKEARTEVRKVVWPTRQETIQTTFIVLVATLIMALILWGLDTFLFWAVGLVTGLQF
ncbi:MAG: preprotein translocase subunit SecE [Thalassotalea sp.]